MRIPPPRKRSMKFTKADAAVVLLTLLLSGLLLYMFLLEFNRTTVVSNLEPAGTIVFRKKTAVRRSLSGLNWERMQNASPVYNGDILRTGEGAEAAILFKEGGGIDLFENTMVSLNIAAEERNLLILKGSLVLTGSADKPDRSTVVSLAGRRIVLSQGASASVSLENNRLELDVNSGVVSVESEGEDPALLSKGQGLKIDLADGHREMIAYPIFPEEPKHNSKYILLNREPGEMEFICSGDFSGAYLEISKNKSFESLFKNLPVGPAGRVYTELPAGVYFWRLNKEGFLSPARRILVLYDRLPAPAFPSEGKVFTYWKEPPEMLFSWVPSELALSYRLELAKDPDFRVVLSTRKTPMSSVSMVVPEDGAWYWRVVPEYPFPVLGSGEGPQINSFVVIKSETMETPVSVYPLTGTLFSISALKGKGADFSWKPIKEASGYNLRIYSEDGKEVGEFGTETPFFRLSGEKVDPFLVPGLYYWDISWKDRDGLLSPPGERKIFYTVESGHSFYLAFPPEGYKIAESLAGNTRFSWKSDIPAITVMEVAEDINFESIIFRQTVQAETLFGRPWRPGTYYWRVTAFNADGSVFVRTKARSFRIIEPYPGPGLLDPAPGYMFLLREGDTRVLTWQDIEGADYYRLFVSRRDPPGQKVYESPPLEGTSQLLPLGEYPEGEYIVGVQAFSTDKPDSTRIIGYIGRDILIYRVLSYAELVSPGQGMVFDGLEARKRGLTFIWRADTPPDWSELRITGPGESEIAGIKNPARETPFPRLDSGNYIWTLIAYYEGIDISSRFSYSFTVLPIPPLPAAELTEPEQGIRIGPERLRENREIRFEWEPVQEATHYILSLYKDSSRIPVLQKLLAEPGYILRDLTVLDRGSFRWTVTAVALEETGSIDIPGTETERAFSIDLPEMGLPRLPSQGDIYGR